MAKDPAFLFYSQDFYTGVATMSWEDRGKYITLLCLMHQQGRMNEETIRFLVGSVSANLRGKFCIDEKGLWYNPRLEAETEKRNRFTESRRNNGKRGGAPKKETYRKPNDNLMVIHTDNRMEDENENENEKKKMKMKMKREKRKEKMNKPEVIMPFPEPEFIPVWEAWKQYKVQEHRFKFASAQSEQIALHSLKNLSGSNMRIAIEIIGQSMANGWKGLFELKKNNNGRSANESDAEKVERIGNKIDEMYRKQGQD